jgi:hypothetical protein
MDLKRFQRGVVRDVGDFLHALDAERAAGKVEFGAAGAWRKEARRRGDQKPYVERRDEVAAGWLKPGQRECP